MNKDRENEACRRFSQAEQKSSDSSKTIKINDCMKA